MTTIALVLFGVALGWTLRWWHDRPAPKAPDVPVAQVNSIIQAWASQPSPTAPAVKPGPTSQPSPTALAVKPGPTSSPAQIGSPRDLGLADLHAEVKDILARRRAADQAALDKAGKALDDEGESLFD